MLVGLLVELRLRGALRLIGTIPVLVDVLVVVALIGVLPGTMEVGGER